MNDKLKIVGLAFRAGKLAAGDAVVSEAVHAKRVRLICTASDASERVLERAKLMPERCNGLFTEIPFTKAELGAALGMNECGIIAFLDPGLAWAFGKKLLGIDEARYSVLTEELAARKGRAQRRWAKKHRPGGTRRGGRKDGS
ncbi:MAG: hypothetical protein FWE28_03235 [Oscillospiraceae bacterium]|nr:hypothetical protein [Oscillospiraceae bacterium]